MDDLDKRIKEANDLMVNDVEEVEITGEPSSSQPTDLLQMQRNARREAEPRKARGAKPKAKIDTRIVSDSNLRHYYKKAKDDSDYYNHTGNKQYARMVKQQYMEDHFLPAIDALVKMNGMGALQTNKDILRQLDALTLLDGTNGSGYTEAFIASMYAPGGQLESSDIQVEQAIREIKALCENDEIRSAVGRANDIKRRIDMGENIASPEDYELIQRVALYGT